MKLYYKYITDLLIRIFSIIILTFAFIVILGQFLKLINKYIGKGNNLLDILYMLVLFLPSLFIYISPIAIFCTIIFVYYKMSVDNELIILEANGLSKYKIAQTSITFAIFITILAYLFTTFINPLAKRELQNQKLISKEGYVSNLLEEKVFNNLTKDLTIYVEKKNKNNELNGVVIYNNIKNKNIIISAEKANFITSNNQLAIVMYNGTRQELNKSNELDILKFTNSKIDLLPSQIKKINKEYSPEEWFISELIFNKPKSSEEKGAIHAELHHRLTWPLLNLALASIASVFIFNINFSRTWHSKPLIFAVIAGFSTIFIHFAIESIAKHNYFFNILLYLNMVFFIVAGLFILKRSSAEKDYFLKLQSKILQLNKNA